MRRRYLDQAESARLSQRTGNGIDSFGFAKEHDGTADKKRRKEGSDRRIETYRRMHRSTSSRPDRVSCEAPDKIVQQVTMGDHRAFGSSG